MPKENNASNELYNCFFEVEEMIKTNYDLLTDEIEQYSIVNRDSQSSFINEITSKITKHLDNIHKKSLSCSEFYVDQMKKEWDILQQFRSLLDNEDEYIEKCLKIPELKKEDVEKSLEPFRKTIKSQEALFSKSNFSKLRTLKSINDCLVITLEVLKVYDYGQRSEVKNALKDIASGSVLKYIPEGITQLINYFIKSIKIIDNLDSNKVMDRYFLKIDNEIQILEALEKTLNKISDTMDDINVLCSLC